MKTDEDTLIRDEIIRDLLSWVINKVNFFEKWPNIPAMSPGLEQVIFEECCSTKNEILVAGLVARLLAPSEEMRLRMDGVLVPFLGRVDQILQSRPKDAPAIPRMAELYRAVMPAFIENKSRDYRGIQSADVGPFITAAVYGGVDALKIL